MTLFPMMLFCANDNQELDEFYNTQLDGFIVNFRFAIAEQLNNGQEVEKIKSMVYSLEKIEEEISKRKLAVIEKYSKE